MIKVDAVCPTKDAKIWNRMLCTFETRIFKIKFVIVINRYRKSCKGLNMLDRLKTLLVRRSEPAHKAVTVYDTQKSIDKPIMKAVVPVIFRSRALATGAYSEKLHFVFCDYCQNPYRKAELIAVKGKVCL